MQEEAQATTEPEETVQEKYLRLAEENLALKEQCSDLYVEYAYYENLRISKSTKGFDLKEQGMFFGALEEENAKLSEEVANLQHQIELYRTMYMGE